MELSLLHGLSSTVAVLREPYGCRRTTVSFMYHCIKYQQDASKNLKRPLNSTIIPGIRKTRNAWGERLLVYGLRSGSHPEAIERTSNFHIDKG